MKYINKDDESQFTLGIDYDGVITRRGSSGLNEEKWIKREHNIFWRKILNFVSIVYNAIFPINEEIIEVCKEVRDIEGHIVIISSHTLTTSNYKESVAARNRVRARLRRENIPFDKIVFVAGNKVDACKEENIDLMIEDNVDKVKALRCADIDTLAKITNKNNFLLEYDPDAINCLTEALPVIHEIIAKKQLIHIASERIEQSSKNNGLTLRKTKSLCENFPSLITEQIFQCEPNYAFELDTTEGMVIKLVPNNKDIK
ncbi:MAG: hypothetical protein PHG03_02430 [Bacilli bacterium]|nr:hypothetical protein [Bacilli bacterium]MDD4795397.1 hypothetical protein [Bacilli bacterium]